MATKEAIANLALISLAADARVNNLTAPVSTVEKQIAPVLDQAILFELSKRRWNFARVRAWASTLQGEATGIDRKYIWNMPPNVLRVLRDNRSDWEIIGDKIYSYTKSGLLLDYIQLVDVAKFPATFVEVIAARTAWKYSPMAGKTINEREQLQRDYITVVKEAAAVNAFEREPEAIGEDDFSFEMIAAGYPGMSDRFTR